MKKNKGAAVIVSVMLAAGLSGAAVKNDLPPVYKEWLETVDPILTSTERDVFLSLTKDEDREKFIKFFWKQHDPFPDTPENEFYREYMNRVLFADRNFSVGAHKKGHLTERGQFYLMLGPPLERERFVTQSDIWPQELWFYKGEPAYGLPAYFYLIFYQPDGIGDFRLFYPGIEGAEKLVIPSVYAEARQMTLPADTLRKISAELASASKSYVAGEGGRAGLSSLSSVALIAGIKDLKEKKFSDAYARSFLSFKDFVETDYSDNFLASAFKARLLRSNGQTVLHWTLEPERVSFARRGDLFVAQFELFLRLEDASGNLVYQSQEEIPIRLNEEQYKSHERRRFALQDTLPVIPGKFKLSVLLKNKTGRDFTSVENTVAIAEETGPRLSHLLLSHGQGPVAEAERARLKPFAFNGVQLTFGARPEFAPGETLVCFLQGAGLEAAAGRTLTFGLYGPDGKSIAAADPRPLEDVLGPGGEMEASARFDLSGVKPEYYEARASVQEADGRILLGAAEPFVLLAQAAPTIPWTLARVRDAFPNPEALTVLATQRFTTGGSDRAVPLLERALALKDSPAARLLLAKTLYSLNRYDESIAAAKPVYEAGGNREAGKILALSLAALKDWSGALVYLEQLLEGAIEVEVLNLAAECLLQLDRPGEAVPLLERSLGLAPSQPAALALLEQARKKS